MLSSSFRAFALYLMLVLLPISVYFYIFHGDWFLLYAVDVSDIPSAVALLGFVCEGLVGVAGFALAAVLVRTQRHQVTYALLGVAAFGAAVALVIWPERLAMVGSYAQYRGDFGLRRYGGALMRGGAAMGLILVCATTYLITRIWFARRRA